jgi:hypothetical protein
MRTFFVFFAFAFLFLVGCNRDKYSVKCQLVKMNAEVSVWLTSNELSYLEEGDTVFLFMHEIGEKEWEYSALPLGPDTTIWVEKCYVGRGSHKKTPSHFVHHAQAVIK